MSTIKKLTNVFNTSKEINFNDDSKFIIMSDCHRGDNTWSDNFAQNENIFITALKYYYIENYTYIEIGDGDELWENKSLKKIITNHLEAFLLMSMFYKRNQFHMLFGNHDIVKNNILLLDNEMNDYYDDNTKVDLPLFPDIDIPEGLILNYEKTNDKILLTHGHQGDFLNDTVWRFSRFLVRNIWRPLELIGIHNPTSTISKDKRRFSAEKRLIEWTKKTKSLLIAGHTHKPAFPTIGDSLYFNDGCCIQPNYITGIEISNGSISLVKWSIKTKKNRSLFIDRDVLAGPIKLKMFFNSL